MAEMTASEMGRKGGYARANNMTPRERTEAARNAVAIRWARKKAADAEAAAKPRKKAK